MGDVTGKRQLIQRRNAWWYVKWVFACNVVSFILFVIVMVISLPIADNAFIVRWFESSGARRIVGGSCCSFALYLQAAPVVVERQPISAFIPHPVGSA